MFKINDIVKVKNSIYKPPSYKCFGKRILKRGEVYIVIEISLSRTDYPIAIAKPNKINDFFLVNENEISLLKRKE